VAKIDLAHSFSHSLEEWKLRLLGFYFAFRLGDELERVEFRPALHAMTWLAFLAALIPMLDFPSMCLIISLLS
jgi:hypothetical protein